MIELTRRYDFPAAHVLRHPSLGDAENEAIYGKCANPSGHGHNYGVEVTVTGPVDEQTGHIVDPALLDAIFDEQVGRPLGQRLLNELPAFRDHVPTAENIALVIHERLGAEVARRSSARVVRVHLVETARNSATTGAPE